MTGGLSAVVTATLFHHASVPVAAAAVGSCVVAVVAGGLRWLRVAQREHYLREETGRFALRWWTSGPINLVLAAVLVVSMVGTEVWPLSAVVTAAVVIVGPVGLSPKGRTSALVFTRRLRRLALVWLVLELAVVLIGLAIGYPAPSAAVAAVAVPLLVDFACGLTASSERRRAQKFVDKAAGRLRLVKPLIVGITGSYGKTSTKNHVTHLVGPWRSVVASPRSFNNRAGLAMAVNEHLAEGTDVFVAEMGTYGPGEIAELCQWCPPRLAVITAIGPVHLERFGSEDKILAAKSEITTAAAVVVLNVDDPRLAGLADRLTSLGALPKVVRCSAVDRRADVAVLADEEAGTVSAYLGGRELAASVAVVPGVQPTNLACALAVAVELAVPEADLAARLASLPPVPNRLDMATAESGVVVLDDTFNSNPAGARAALAALQRAGGDGPSHRKVLVTPGMVELGPQQVAQNRLLAAEAVAAGVELVAVGRTNRKALGAGAGGAPVVTVDRRPQAVAWVRANLGPGDAVLYENDLPDHYP